MYLQVKFSSNPNGKLFQDYFGDIRLPDEKFTVGNTMDVYFKSNNIGRVQIVATKDFKICNLTDSLSLINIGKHARYQVDLLNRYYATAKLNGESIMRYVVFKWVVRDLQYHQSLLQEWWQSKVDQQPAV